MLYILSFDRVGVELFTQHLTLETCQPETTSQLQRLLLSCFCVEVLFENFFYQEMNLAGENEHYQLVFIINVHVLGHTV